MDMWYLIFDHVHVVVCRLRLLFSHFFQMAHQVWHIHPELLSVDTVCRGITEGWEVLVLWAPWLDTYIIHVACTVILTSTAAVDWGGPAPVGCSCWCKRWGWVESGGWQNAWLCPRGRRAPSPLWSSQHIWDRGSEERKSLVIMLNKKTHSQCPFSVKIEVRSWFAVARNVFIIWFIKKRDSTSCYSN